MPLTWRERPGVLPEHWDGYRSDGENGATPVAEVTHTPGAGWSWSLNLPNGEPGLADPHYLDTREEAEAAAAEAAGLAA